MKILLISPLPPPAGGIATWTKRYLNSIFVAENEIFLINNAVKNTRLKEYKKIILKEELKRSLNIFSEIRNNISGIEIVHLNTSCSPLGIIRDYLYLKYLKIKNKKIVVHYHCNIEDMINTKYQNFFLKQIINLSDLNIVLNKFSEEYLKKIKKNIKIEIIPNFILENDFKELSLAKKSNKSRKIKRILYTGHVTESKGCKELLEVAKYFPELDFVLIGKINDSEFKKCNLKNVSFLGEQSFEKIKIELLKADLFLFLSHTEGFTISLLEAMSAGLPIIATDVGANRDMIEEGGGIVVKKKDVSSVKNALLEIQNNPILMSEMKKFNINKVKKNYLQNDVLKKIFFLYEGVLNDNKEG